jgi:hypothetical protein
LNCMKLRVQLKSGPSGPSANDSIAESLDF